MYASEMITYTAYSYYALGNVAVLLNIKYATVCNRVADIRHLMAMDILQQQIEIPKDITLYDYDYDDVATGFKDVYDNDNLIINLLKPVLKNGKYDYIINSLVHTSLLVRSYYDFFNGKMDTIYNDAYICIDCGCTSKEKIDECGYCGSDARRIVRIDML